MSNDVTRVRQEERQRRFPPDRIAFYSGPGAVIADNNALARWANGFESFDWLRSAIAYNNYLDHYFPNGMIPEDMMLSELRHIGWSRRL